MLEIKINAKVGVQKYRLRLIYLVVNSVDEARQR